jgi:selenocysteine-specific translation elongation factor
VRISARTQADDQLRAEENGSGRADYAAKRRTKTIHLTAAGEALARETADRVAETEQQALSQFSEEEADQLFSLLRRLNALMIDIFPQTMRNPEGESKAK